MTEPMASIGGGVAIAIITAWAVSGLYRSRRADRRPKTDPAHDWLIPIAIAIAAVVLGQLVGAGVLWLEFGRACR